MFTLQPKNASELVHLPIEQRPLPLVVANASERQGPAAAVLSDCDDTAIGKVSRKGASALGTGDSLWGSAMIYEPSTASVKFCVPHVYILESSRFTYQKALSAGP